MFDRTSYISLLKPDRDWSQCIKEMLTDECATRFLRRQADYPDDFGSAALRRRLPALIVDGECGLGSLCDLYAADRLGDPVVMERYLYAETNYMTWEPRNGIERALDHTNGLLLYKEDCRHKPNCGTYLRQPFRLPAFGISTIVQKVGTLNPDNGGRLVETADFGSSEIGRPQAHRRQRQRPAPAISQYRLATGTPAKAPFHKNR